VKRRFAALAWLGTAALSLATAAPTNAATHIHCYTYEDPRNRTLTTTVDVLVTVTTPAQHKVGDCKNVWVGRDFYNESGRVVQIFLQPDCQNLTYQLLDGQAVTDTRAAQSVKVVAN
jgi:hypothetical protein